MNGKHPKTLDVKTKRRRFKDNPYTLFTTGIDSEYPHYYLTFSVDNVQRCIEIDETLYTVLNRFELDDLSYMAEMDRHYEHSVLTEETLAQRAASIPETVDEIVMRRMVHEQLRQSIAQLPETQRRRLVLYYFGSFTYQQIADMEGCTIMPVKRSIDQAIKKLKKIFEKGG